MEQDKKHFAASDNPFGWTLLSGYFVFRGGCNDKSRLRSLQKLNDMLDAKGWSQMEKLSLYRFMEAILRPKSLELQLEYKAWLEDKNKEGNKMYMPILEINLRKLEENARTEKALLASSGIEVMAVNKVFDGCVETAQAVFDGGIKVIAESRTYNLKKIREIGVIRRIRDSDHERCAVPAPRCPTTVGSFAPRANWRARVQCPWPFLRRP